MKLRIVVALALALASLPGCFWLAADAASPGGRFAASTPDAAAHPECTAAHPCAVAADGGIAAPAAPSTAVR